MHKRCFRFGVALLPLLCLVAAVADSRADDFIFRTNGNTAAIVRYTGSCHKVAIPAKNNDGVPVTSIGRGAFGGCSHLTSVTIPYTVTSIEEYAFHGCSKLRSVVLPATVTSIGRGAFVGCKSLTKITVPTENPCYSSVKGILFNKNQTTLIEYPCGKAGSYSIPGGVRSIGERAFFDCKTICTITIPDSVTAIGNAAFYRCSSLTGITIPKGVSSIGEWTFAYCLSLSRVTVPDSIRSIGDSAFFYCRWLGNVSIPGSITNIGKDAFDTDVRILRQSRTAVPVGK